MEIMMVEKKRSNLKTRLSVFIMGFACITGKQPVKGIIYLLIEAAFIFYMVTFGVPALSFITTLGKTQQGMVFDEDRGSRTAPLGIRIREYLPDIREAQCSQYSIHHTVKQHIP